MIYKFEEIQAIIKGNPNKALIDKGVDMANKLMLHIHGVGMENAIKHCDHFASKELYKVQKEYAVSNKDLFARLLQQEDMVFTARGGSSYFNLPDNQEKQMNMLLSDVRFGMSLRKWMRNFALHAYRSDPMGIIFMEVDQVYVDESGQLREPKTYPTYKSIYSIYDYLPNGRQLEYVCFKLTVGEAIRFGIKDDKLNGRKKEEVSEYYRFIDDAKDLIVKYSEGKVSLATNIEQKNPIPNQWKRVPGFIISDLILFNDPSCFVSPVSTVVELANCFLQDRSVRDLQKKYHGYAKAVEPLLTCSTCSGNKSVNGQPCTDCTPPGGEPTGYKLRTKVSDVARFPLDIFNESSFDFKKVFGYVTPDIQGWEKQDASLEDLEELMEMTYWGTIRMKRPKPGISNDMTATEVNSNDAPKEARLNMTADWAEKTEQMIADFIAKYWFEDSFKNSSIAYGRDYILKTADELMKQYQEMRSNGAPDFSLDQALENYYQAKYQNNPVQLAISLKKLNVEPFPHISINNAKSIITDFNDYNAKLYFGEWADTIKDIMWISTPADKLRQQLKEYVKAKNIVEPSLGDTKANVSLN